VEPAQDPKTFKSSSNLDKRKKKMRITAEGYYHWKKKAFST
jgi:hypothetical protein